MAKEVGALTAFADKAKADGIKHVVLLGMGGSSLAPEVFQQTFGNALGLSRTARARQHPSGGGEGGRSPCRFGTHLIPRVEQVGDDDRDQFFFYYFWDKLKQIKSEPGSHFVAITDPGTPLEKLAAERHFRATFNAPEEVGGRYAALTVSAWCLRH